MSGVALGAGIAQPAPGPHALVVVALLRRRASQAKQVQEAEMVLRDLTQRRIRRADDAKHVGQRHMRDIRAAEFARHRDAAQPAGRIACDLAPGQSAFPVALGRA
ncbi:hypothetical protein G6F64_014324 [Rhizopus arrhizus]|uniref:Uncharacterized protein n=1 Tax=Rhizopus oryzae TaxID=64495 RepID=A0A9P6WU28_RHIOR|nr:hypothetical protein G6F64_014324 [Rhizopus arrhizus]